MPLYTRHATTTTTFCSALELPNEVIRLLADDQQNSNIILPYILKARVSEREGQAIGNNLWIVSYTTQATGESVVDFVTAITDGPISTYPIFIYHARPLATLTPAFLEPRMTELVQALLGAGVSIERVFSVFAVEPVTHAFVDEWRSITGVCIDPEYKGGVYYAAYLSYCDRRSFRPRAMTIDPNLAYAIRLATMDDLDIVASLCHGFASGSDPFILTMDQARTEALGYIKKEQMWVHEITHRDGTRGIASICAVTRTTAKVAGITKVYTNPEYRKMGCALRLVRGVCDHYFKIKGKESLVLYVAHDNAAARGVYHRVGFRGLDGSKPSPAGVEPWLEVGFNRDVVRLGHW